MKKLTQLAAAVALASGAISAAPVMAEGALSANVGVVSSYYYRGLEQTEGAAVSAGVDYEDGGFYAGVWASQVEEGEEVDVYFGYGIETESGLGLSAGFTTYQYTDNDFDTEYNEVNLGMSFGIASVEYSVGERDGDGAPDEDYTFAALTLESNGFYGTYGNHGGDYEGAYVELGYGTEIAGLDAGVALLLQDEDLSSNGEKDEILIFSIGKSFDL